MPRTRERKLKSFLSHLRRLLTPKSVMVTAGFLSILVTSTAVTQVCAGNKAAPKVEGVVNDFELRVNGYLSKRKREAGTSPRSTSSAEKLDDSQHSLAEKSRDTRSEAKQGQIFTPEIARYFRKQIAKILAGPHGSEIRASLLHAEPVGDLALQTNQVYPEGMSLQSTPATLLLNLPPLPKELEYRLVSNSLVLLDIAPRLVVDFLPNALPPREK
jgi:hypothetical protein